MARKKKVDGISVVIYEGDTAALQGKKDIEQNMGPRESMNTIMLDLIEAEGTKRAKKAAK